MGTCLIEAPASNRRALRTFTTAYLLVPENLAID
jgi:hypothetical protein